ncbi:hypothetical protein [Chryseobacterium sp. GP-SGM7]|uniref:hypothetical protein n=1 Tax=Chryseobacterium sp. GP-SGM7 TaxID=3411323 RepID=UPI003B961DB4
MEKNILKQLKTDYEDLELKPSVNLWDKIENELEGDKETVQKPAFQWWKYAAVIILLISLGGGLFYFNSDENSRSKETIAVKKPLENNFKQNEVAENHISNESIVQNPISIETEIYVDKNELTSVSETLTKKTDIPKNLAITEKETKSPEVFQPAIEKLEIPVVKSLVAEKKKASYISADDLLIGRELDKTREENNKDQRKFGVFDMSKIKVPNSLKIFGFSVISDSLYSE